MKGPAPIPIPDDFTLDWYAQQKELRIPDRNIADTLYISYSTLHNWKQKVGWISGHGSKYCGRKPHIDKQQVIELRATGLTYSKIAEIIGCSERSVSYIYQNKRQNKRMGERKNVSPHK
jgi:DNA invertase Pin-like site-specific DNA recombinase